MFQILLLQTSSFKKHFGIGVRFLNRNKFMRKNFASSESPTDE